MKKKPIYEIPLPPDGRLRLAAVAAKKHVTIYTKSKRGLTDPKLKELRKRLSLSSGFLLQKSQSGYAPLYGTVYVKNAITKEIVRVISAEEVMRILNV